MDRRNDESHLRRLIEQYVSGALSLEDVLKAISCSSFEPAGPSMLLSVLTMEECFAGRISYDKALRIVEAQAERNPALPSAFLVCGFIHDNLGSFMNACGCIALALEKERLFFREDAILSMLTDHEHFERYLTRIEADPLMRTAYPYVGEADPFLVKHFLLNDICSYEKGFTEPQELHLLLNSCGDVESIISNFFSDVLRLPQVPPLTVISLMRLLGHVKPASAIEPLIESLSSTWPECVNEAVLTLAKIGSRYPAAVSNRMRSIIRNKQMFDEHLPAIEVLGYLWKYEKNLEFLIAQLERLNPAEPHFEYKFCSIAVPLLETGDRRAIDSIRSNLWKHGKHFDDKIRGELEHTIRISVDLPQEDRLEKILSENIYEICCEEMDPDAEEFRITNTFIREIMLADEEEIELDNIGFLKLFISTDPDKPCFCRSGSAAKDCCLDEFLLLFRDIMSEYRLNAYDAYQERVQKFFESIEEFLFNSWMREEVIVAIHEFWEPVIRSGMLDSALHSLEYPYADMLFDWLIFGKRFAPDGRRAVEIFENSCDVDIKPGVQRIMRSFSSTHKFSCFEVQKIKPPLRVELKDLFGGEIFEVKDPWMAESLVLWDVVFTSVAFTGKEWLSLPRYVYVPRSQLYRVEKYVRRKMRESHSCSGTVDQGVFLEGNAHRIIHYIFQLCAKCPETTLVTAEGEEIAGCSAVYEIVDREGLVSVLESHPMMEKVNSARRPGSQDVYAWFSGEETENIKGDLTGLGGQLNGVKHSVVDEWSVRSVELEAVDSNGTARKLFGIVKLKNDRLSFETASIGDLEKGKIILSKLCKDLISHRVDAIEDQSSFLSKTRGGKRVTGGRTSSEIHAGDLLNQNVRIRPVSVYDEEFFSRWLEEPYARLGGKTPRQASQTKSGRAKVARILKDFENAIEKDGRRGRKSFRLDFLRKKLGISLSKDILDS